MIGKLWSDFSNEDVRVKVCDRRLLAFHYGAGRIVEMLQGQPEIVINAYWHFIMVRMRGVMTCIDSKVVINAYWHFIMVRGSGQNY